MYIFIYANTQHHVNNEQITICTDQIITVAWSALILLVKLIYKFFNIFFYFLVLRLK